MKKIYSAGIVGCGRIGCGFDEDPKRKFSASHARAYIKSPRTNLTALCDIDEQKLEKYGQHFRMKNLYTDYREMIIKENLEVISICTLANTHKKIVIDAIDLGVKGIYCEKPIALNLADAEEIVKKSDESKVPIMLGYFRRCDPVYRDIKKFLDQKALGIIQQANFIYGGGIANTGSHLFDLLRFYFGEVKWIQGNYSDILSKNPEDPNIDAMIKFDNGTLATIQSIDTTKYALFELDMLGTKGRIRIPLLGEGAEYYTIGSSNQVSEINELFPKKHCFGQGKMKEPTIYSVNHLIDCIENGDTPFASAKDGLKSLELVCVAHRSARNNGKKITLPVTERNIQINSK